MKFYKIVCLVLCLFGAVLFVLCLRFGVYRFDSSIDPQGKYSFTYDEGVWESVSNGEMWFREDLLGCSILTGEEEYVEDSEYNIISSDRVDLVYVDLKLKRVLVDIGLDGDSLKIGLFINPYRYMTSVAPEMCIYEFEALIKEAFPYVKLPVDMSYEEWERMVKYEDKTYGLSFGYPSRLSQHIGENFLYGVPEISFNVSCPPEASCPINDLSIIVVLGIPRDPAMPFLDFLGSVEDESQNGWKFSDGLNKDIFGGRDAFRTNISNCCFSGDSYAYLFELTEDTYGEMVIISELFDNAKVQEDIEKVLDSVEFAVVQS